MLRLQAHMPARLAHHQVLYCGAVGQVMASRTPAFAVGAIVLSNNGWREYVSCDSVEGEIGDFCAWQTKRLSPWLVQKEWSNALGTCA